MLKHLQGVFADIQQTIEKKVEKWEEEMSNELNIKKTANDWADAMSNELNAMKNNLQKEFASNKSKIITRDNKLIIVVPYDMVDEDYTYNVRGGVLTIHIKYHNEGNSLNKESVINAAIDAVYDAKSLNIKYDANKHALAFIFDKKKNNKQISNEDENKINSYYTAMEKLYKLLSIGANPEEIQAQLKKAESFIKSRDLKNKIANRIKNAITECEKKGE